MTALGERSFEERLRTRPIDDARTVAEPENRQPSEGVIVPAPDSRAQWITCARTQSPMTALSSTLVSTWQ
jgi:hypothetical protein